MTSKQCIFCYATIISALIIAGCGTSSSVTPPTSTSKVANVTTPASSSTSSNSATGSSTSTSTSSTSTKNAMQTTRQITAIKQELARKQQELDVYTQEKVQLDAVANQADVQSVAATVTTDPAALKNAGFWGFLSGIMNGTWSNVAQADTNAANSQAKLQQASEIKAQIVAQEATLDGEIASVNRDIADLQNQLNALIDGAASSASSSSGTGSSSTSSTTGTSTDPTGLSSASTTGTSSIN